MKLLNWGNCETCKVPETPKQFLIYCKKIYSSEKEISSSCEERKKKKKKIEKPYTFFNCYAKSEDEDTNTAAHNSVLA
ncbi:hypothetical protein CROQUDRAFT_463945 [Cronartium quercuum f. sp. fusiforme G11]|uniref:Uncharacterized protein n=1 Tax=Cronartium quercuum f. sp. fusiforme G11 TaxID=708437 RepID=A0A9P6TH61_9BASI|nr:hypothetical protein CROQUDRAFT_463945 [Cronartium quercuum f. sp. fusiforme G11]